MRAASKASRRRRQAPSAWGLPLLVMLLAAGLPGARAQLSKGIVGDHNVDTKGNKFLQRKATEDTTPPPPK